MNTIRETVPASWSETDERFFRVVAEVFPVDFTWGAGTLLASYDTDQVDASAAPAGPRSTVDVVADPSAVRA